MPCIYVLSALHLGITQLRQHFPMLTHTTRQKLVSMGFPWVLPTVLNTNQATSAIWYDFKQTFCVGYVLSCHGTRIAALC